MSLLKSLFAVSLVISKVFVHSSLVIPAFLRIYLRMSLCLEEEKKKGSCFSPLNRIKSPFIKDRLEKTF